MLSSLSLRDELHQSNGNRECFLLSRILLEYYGKQYSIGSPVA